MHECGSVHFHNKTGQEQLDALTAPSVVEKCS